MATSPPKRIVARTTGAATTTRTSRSPTPVRPQELRKVATRHVLEYVDINDLAPYPYNPRDNAGAIKSVAESIKAFGFLVPCVIDAENILVCGHTRVEAAKTLGLIEVPCIRATSLTQEQINAFRLIDNKVAENAKWDHELLAGEINKLGDMGLDWTAFGWTQDAIDCMQELVSADCLSAATLIPADATATEAAHVARRSPQTARVVIGEIVFFVPITMYRNWVDGMRQLHNFSEDGIAEDIKGRLGMLT